MLLKTSLAQVLNYFTAIFLLFLLKLEQTLFRDLLFSLQSFELNLIGLYLFAKLLVFLSDYLFIKFFDLLDLFFDASSCEIILGAVIDSLGDRTQHQSYIFLLLFKLVPDLNLLNLQLLYLLM